MSSPEGGKILLSGRSVSDVLEEVSFAGGISFVALYYEADTPVIIDKDELEIIKDVRKKPEIKNQAKVIIRALATQQEGIGGDITIHKKGTGQKNSLTSLTVRRAI